MSGIYGIFADSFDKDFPYYSLMLSSVFENVNNIQYAIGDRGVIGRSSLDKFQNDRFFYQDNEWTILNEGILLNYDRNDLPEVFIHDFKSKGDQLFQDLAGTYSGIIVDKHGEKIKLYNDFLGSRPLYYYHEKRSKTFVFSSELKFFAQFFRQLGIEYFPDELAWRELSVNGYLFGSHTLIEGVGKLPRNSILNWDNKTSELTIVSQGKNLDSGMAYESQSKLFDDIASRLLWSVKASREKDLSYGYEHFQALSGGLDSRLNVALAHHLGYEHSHTLTFTQSGTCEESCARAFGQYLGLNQKVEYLDTGDYLKTDLFASGLANDGLVMIHGAAQQYHNIRKNIKPEHGMLHSGQIGDVVFGSFTKWRHPADYMIRKQAFFRDDAVFDRFFENDPRINKYADNKKSGFALFALEERMVNAGLNGDIVCSQFVDSYSPFFDRELINIMYNQPAELLKNQKVYIEFLKNRFPFILDVRIDRSLLKPTGYYRYIFGRDIMRVWNKINPRNNMNPYDIWFNENKDLKVWLDEQLSEFQNMYFEKTWLNNLVRKEVSKFNGYLQPLTLYLAYDTHFGEQNILKQQMGQIRRSRSV